jgi:excinuclease ABC subunit C
MVRAARAALPHAPGVYRFRDARGRVLYVGRAIDLRRRVASYWGDLGDRRHLRRMVAAVARIEAVVCASEHEAAWLERNLLEQRLAPANRTAGGQEVPVAARLDRSAATPGLTVVHEPRPGPELEHFGPYLGGVRARLAVAALNRVHPLGYAGTRLTEAERELAARRGVDPSQRQALVAAVTAVLVREPAAVAAAEAALVERRGQAAATGGYELAARIQQELEALAWLAAPQRVTTLDPLDADVHGFADGVLVSFAIRGGRLCQWRARRTSRAEVAATPPAWRAFAQENAELAARLLHAGDG